MKNVLLVLVVASAMTGARLGAQEPARGPASPAALRVEDEKAIGALLEAFIKAFNSGDARAAAATYTETAIVVDERGERTEGRAAIEGQYSASFAGHPGGKIAIQVDALRMLGPDTAIEVGRTTITPASDTESPEVTRFTAIYLKQGGRWLQSAVRDEFSHAVTAHDRLKELEWLVGNWVNESEDAVVTTTCKWAKGGNFIDREFSVKAKGEPVLSGTQRFGWDPLKRQFKTWIFDSEGGHGEGYLARDGNRWVIKVEGVSQDGLSKTATNVVTRLGKDRMSWQSVDRTLGGAAIQGVDEFVVVRTPPEVGK